MKLLSNEEYENYRKFKQDVILGRILTPEGLRVICDGFENNPEQIGIHMLEMLSRYEKDGRYDG